MRRAASGGDIGSVASGTEASADGTRPRAVVSPTRLAAVVINPVHAAAPATVRGGVEEEPGRERRRAEPRSSTPREEPAAVEGADGEAVGAADGGDGSGDEDLTG